jgi:hypothetical protein
VTGGEDLDPGSPTTAGTNVLTGTGNDTAWWIASAASGTGGRYHWAFGPRCFRSGGMDFTLTFSGVSAIVADSFTVSDNPRGAVAAAPARTRVGSRRPGRPTRLVM